MRAPILLISILFIFSLLICGLFISDNPKTPEPGFDMSLIDTGRVLGISEAMADHPARSLDFSLYERAGLYNINKEPAPPQKVGSEEDISLPGGQGVVIDVDSGAVLFGQSAEDVAPIASITKLAAALVFLENNPGWDKIYEIRTEDRVDGGIVYLISGEKIKVRDLFYLSLVASANTAAKALINSTGIAESSFVGMMNKKMRDLGLNKTNFVDPVGINSLNISTALEAAKLTRVALEKDDIREATLTRKYEFLTAGGRKKTVYNTDVLLEIFPQNGIKIMGGKTGYIDLAGYCFVGKFTNEAGHEIIAVVLGSKSLNSRFKEAKDLVEWTYRNYEWLR